MPYNELSRHPSRPHDDSRDIEDGTVVEEWNVGDSFTVLQQLELLPQALTG